MERDQPSQNERFSDSSTQNHPIPIRTSDFFAFLKAEEEQPKSTSSSFFSKNGLNQDILQVTGAEPDICLEVFYALYNVLWPQIQKHSDISFKDAWANFIGNAVMKGSLCPPERLIQEKRPNDLTKNAVNFCLPESLIQEKRFKDLVQDLSSSEGEKKFFRELDQVVKSISDLKQRVIDCPDEILQRGEITASLDLVKSFYIDYRTKVKALVQVLIEKEPVVLSDVLEFYALKSLLEPKAVMMSDLFCNHWAYRIPRAKAKTLLSLNEYGHRLKDPSNGLSSFRITALPENSHQPMVYFKANGNSQIQPEKDFMLYSLYQHLQIPVPETALLILTDIYEWNSNYFYTVQASEAVIGEPALEAWRNLETAFEEEAYALQVIGALLTNPSDGSLKNFKYSSMYKTLVSINNNSVFKPEISEEGERKMINMKSTLYLLPQIELPIPESLKTFFTTLDPQLTIFSWLQDLFQKNAEYNLLFTRLAFQRTRCFYQNLLPQDETPVLAICLEEKILVDPYHHSDSFYSQILVSQELLRSIAEKLQLIRKTLSNNLLVSAQTLFEELTPSLGKYYQRLRSEFSDPEEAFSALWGEKINGVDYLEISSLLDCGELGTLSSNNLLLESRRPEEFIEEFKNKCTSQVSPLDFFIQRQNLQRKKNALNLRIALKELQFLVKEGLTESQFPRDIIDFCHNLTQMTEADHHLRTKIISILSNLPSAELKWLFTLERYFSRADDDYPKNLRESSIPLTGALMKERVFNLTESDKSHLFDSNGNIRRSSSFYGRSNVTDFPNGNPQFYLKQYPECPGFEFASILFMRMLGVDHLPYQDLMIINSKYPALLTKAVEGNPVFRVWENPKAFSNLDPFQTGLQIISAMLINPEDGKEDNFILSPDGRFLIPIDNDHCFLPSCFQKERGLWNVFTINVTLQTKTILFCLDEMCAPIPNEVKQHILSLDFDSLLTKWMSELYKLEMRFSNLADEDQQAQFFKKGTILKIQFYEKIIENIYWKANKIQDILKSVSQPTPFDLFKALEPFAARCYRGSFHQTPHLRSRFMKATENLYKKTEIDGSRVSLLDTRAMMEIIYIPLEEIQNNSGFKQLGPLGALELLKQLIEERYKRAKLEQELLYELDEKIQEEKSISLFGNSSGETAVKQFFANPKEGLALKGSKLIVNGKLKELFSQTPERGIRIRFLSLPFSPLLTEREIRRFAKECPNLEYLNVSGCKKLIEIVTEKKEWPLLARLEAKDCLKLEKVASYSPLKILRIETDRKIEIFVEKFSLEIFTISKKANQCELTLTKGGSVELKSWNQATSASDSILNLLSEEKAAQKYLRDIKITMGKWSISSGKDLVDFVTNLNFHNLNIDVGDIKRMRMLKISNLKRLDLSRNKLKGADYLEHLVQGNWPKLKYLNLSDNEIFDEGLETMTRGNWPLLETLNLKNTGVSKRGLVNFLLNSNFPNLPNLDVGISGKDIFNSLLRKYWSALEKLDLTDCGITKKEVEVLVDKSDWPFLKHLILSDDEVYDEGLKILTRGNWPRLETLSLKKTKITTRGVELIVNHAKWNKIKHLNLSYNDIDDRGLQILAQAGWPLLEILNLEKITGTKQGLLRLVSDPKRANIKEIKFDWDVTINLVQRNWHLLEELNLSGCEITQNEIELMVYKCRWPWLKHLDLSNNYELDDEALEVLCQGNWLVLESLCLENTAVTKKSLLSFLLRANWPNFKTLLLPKWWNPSDAEIAFSFVQKDLSQLDRLELNNLRNDDCTKIEIILSKNSCFKLKYLNISNNEISEEGKVSLLGVIECPLLEELHLRNIKLSSNELEAILNKSNWQRLKHLDISHNRIFDEGLPGLVLADWPLLESLTLNNTNLSLQGVEAILDISKWQQLKHLDVSQNELFDEGLSILALVDWSLLESLNLSQVKCSSKGIEVLANQSKWPQLKQLDVSDNGIFDEGLLVLSSAAWPFLEELNLKNTKITQQGLKALVNQVRLQKLNISGNIIGDEGLEILASAEWLLFEHLIYYDTQVTKKGHITLLENLKWPNFTKLEHSLCESFYSYDENQDQWSPTETILAMTPMSYKKQSLMVIVLDINWLNSNEIFLSIKHQDLNEKIVLLPRNKLRQLELIHLHFCVSPKIKALQSIILPPNLKVLDLSNNLLSNDEKLKILAFKNCSQLQEFSLKNTNITTKGLEILCSKANCMNLKKLDLSQNRIQDRGLDILASANFSLLETLDLENTQLRDEGLEILINESDWPNLKKLNLSHNQIKDKGLEILCSGMWPLLESLDLKSLSFTEKGIESIINRSQWPTLRILDLSYIGNISDEGFESLASGKWPFLECLYLNSTNIERKVVEALINEASWPNIREISLWGNIDLYDHKDAIKELVFKKWPNAKLTI